MIHLDCNKLSVRRLVHERLAMQLTIDLEVPERFGAAEEFRMEAFRVVGSLDLRAKR